jgi:hypothetical protein
VLIAGDYEEAKRKARRPWLAVSEQPRCIEKRQPSVYQCADSKIKMALKSHASATPRQRRLAPHSPRCQIRLRAKCGPICMQGPTWKLPPVQRVEGYAKPRDGT